METEINPNNCNNFAYKGIFLLQSYYVSHRLTFILKFYYHGGNLAKKLSFELSQTLCLKYLKDLMNVFVSGVCNC